MKNLPPRHDAVIHGQKLAYRLAPGDGVTMVLINGAGGPMEGWFRLFPDITRSGTVFAYDRPGVGASPQPTSAQTGAQVVETLRSLLKTAELTPPYLLVAHSFGGLHANLFARRHPDEVLGLVLIEPTTPEDVTALKPLQSSAQRFVNGLLNRLSPANPMGEIAQELETVREVATAGPFPNRPLVVIAGGKPPKDWQARSEAQVLRRQHLESLSRLSPQGSLVLAANSGHFPQISEPDVVLEAIATLSARLAPSHAEEKA
ncbi:MAG: alpha/beta fold hydrolase [Caulobacterales bacterium]|nr:alpha/beta fold hydrolase [Caulobacterales bacterium]